MQGKPEWKKHETGPFGEYLYTQEDYHKLRARLATCEDALRTISLGKSDGLDHAEDVARLERAVNIARKALEDNK